MKAQKKLSRLLFAVLMLTLATVACGGSTDTGTKATPTFVAGPQEPSSTQTPVEPRPPASDLVEAQVTRVVDGDTIEVLIDGVEYRLRYIGIDTPETKHPTSGVEPFGPEASQANSELVEGKTVLLERDVSEVDRYGRLLRYVYVDDLMVNEELLRRGLARVATFPPDVKYVDRFLEVQRAAQKAGMGMWGVELTATPASSSSLVVETWGYTYQRPDGNRLVSGKGTLPRAVPLDIPLDGQPLWLVAAPVSGGSVWVAVLTDGRVQAFHVAGRRVTPIAIELGQLPPGMPPLLRVTNDVPNLITNPTAEASPLTHPVVLPDSQGQLAFIETSGDLVIWNGEEAGRVAVKALPDARLLVDELGRILLLSDATTRYAHGVLGDEVEAASITLVETTPVLRVAQQIEIPPPSVVEDIAPIWTDLTGDGTREIIVTLSDVDQGARIAVFSEDGEQIAVGPAIGQGYQWRHQLAVAPTGADGDLEVIDVMTPHIGGIVDFFQLAGDGLKLMDQMSGYTSHVLGSRNLDMAAAGDFDGDGQMELLLPDQERTSLGAIRRSTGSAEVAWRIPAGEGISTNLCAVTFPDGTLAAGVGHEGNQLRLWLP
jgi:endonuclease YncB( thermonuclease family)